MSNIHNNKFSKYYDAIKELHSKNKTAKQIIKELNVPELNSPRQIYKIISSQGWSKDINLSLKEKFREKDLKALELIASGISCRETAKILNIDQQSMNLRLKRFYNFEVLPDGKKYINSTFFSVIDTEEKAYWLGFLYADGYVGKNNNIELTLCNKDYDHLVKFKNAIDSKHNISEKYVCLNNKSFKENRISFRDKNMGEDLKKLGCIQNKSNVIVFHSFLKNNIFVKDFIRGYFDGDGCIISDTYTVSITSGSFQMLSELSDYLNDKLGTNFKIKKSHLKNSVFDMYSCSKKSSILFLNYIYKDCKVALTRKYNKYLNLICRYETNTDKVS